MTAIIFIVACVSAGLVLATLTLADDQQWPPPPPDTGYPPR